MPLVPLCNHRTIPLPSFLPFFSLQNRITRTAPLLPVDGLGAFFLCASTVHVDAAQHVILFFVSIRHVPISTPSLVRVPQIIRNTHARLFLFDMVALRNNTVEASKPGGNGLE